MDLVSKRVSLVVHMVLHLPLVNQLVCLLCLVIPAVTPLRVVEYLAKFFRWSDQILVGAFPHFLDYLN